MIYYDGHRVSLIFHISSVISRLSSPEAIMKGVTAAAHRIESGLVHLAWRGTSGQSKQPAKKLLNRWQMKNGKWKMENGK
jgi:hypothetical protein